VENALPEFLEIGSEPGPRTGFLVSGFVEEILLEPGILIPSPDAIHLTWRNRPKGGILEASSDFLHWTRLDIPGGSVLDAIELFDEPASGNAPRFYRVRVPKAELFPLFPPPSTNSIAIGPGITIRPISR
jgi:hypothetical protein